MQNLLTPQGDGRWSSRMPQMLNQLVDQNQMVVVSRFRGLIWNAAILYKRIFLKLGSWQCSVLNKTLNLIPNLTNALNRCTFLYLIQSLENPFIWTTLFECRIKLKVSLQLGRRRKGDLKRLTWSKLHGPFLVWNPNLKPATSCFG